MTGLGFDPQVSAAVARLSAALNNRYPGISNGARDDAVLRTLTTTAEILESGWAVQFHALDADRFAVASCALVTDAGNAKCGNPYDCTCSHGCDIP